MSNTSSSSHVEISSGRVTGSSITDANGTRPVPVLVETRFFVDVIEPDGCRISIWDGPSYDTAIMEARNAAKDWDASGVLDLVPGGAA
jgi:hypothetical protein